MSQPKTVGAFFVGNANVRYPLVIDVNADGLDDIVGMQPDGGRLNVARSDGVRLKSALWNSDFPVGAENGGFINAGNYVTPMPSLSTELSTAPTGPGSTDSVFDDEDELSDLLASI